MADLEFRITASEAELLDAGEAIEALLGRDGEGDLPPSLVELLLALDDAVTSAVAESHDPAAPMRHRDGWRTPRLEARDSLGHGPTGGRFNVGRHG